MTRHATKNASANGGWWKSWPRRATAAGASAALVALAAAPAVAITPTAPQITAATPSSSVDQERGRLLSVTPLGGQDREQIVAAAKKVGFTGSVGEWRRVVRHDVTAYRLTYRTITPTGHTTTASGLLVLPRGAAHRLPTVVQTHGTMTHRNRAPSVHDTGPDRIASLVYAAGGRAAVAPDYLGLGLGPGTHPFMDTRSSVSATLDMLRAADAAAGGGQLLGGLQAPRLKTAPGTLSRDIHVTGGSQGGQVAMGFGRALDSGADPRFRLRGLTPVSGPYDIEHAELPGMFDGQVDAAGAAFYIAYLLVVQNRLHSLYTDPHDVFRTPYADTIESLFDGEHSQEEVVEHLPGTLRELLTPKWYEKLRHPSGTLLEVIRANDTTCSWAPPVPVTLYAATGDRDIPIANTLNCARQLRERGSTATVVDLGGADHYGSLLRSILPIARSLSTDNGPQGKR